MYTYDAVGNKTSTHTPNGVTQTYTYDSQNHLVRLTTTDANNDVMEQYDYTLDATGKRLSLTELTGRTTTWAYDDLNRLVSACRRKSCACRSDRLALLQPPLQEIGRLMELREND